MHINWNETIVLCTLIAAVTIYRIIALFLDPGREFRTYRDAFDEPHLNADDVSSSAKIPASNQ